jgi:5-methylcytosine-specific restriction protein B
MSTEENTRDPAGEALADEGDDLALADGGPDSTFYWRQTRENLPTAAGLRIFQLSYAHKDEEYESARLQIDEEYSRLSPRLKKKGGEAARHGGYFSTYINFLEEMGLMYRKARGGKVYLRATPAGDQAALLLGKLPETLRVIPYFIVELLSRYRFKNPLNKSPKNQALAGALAESDIFPYWSLYKIMRGAANTITKDELARFVFKTKRMAEIPTVISGILASRGDRARGLTDEEIDDKYGKPLTGVIAQPKFIMGRAGVQVGVITQDDEAYQIDPAYLPFIDQLLAQEPGFEELDEETWIREYGDPVAATEPQYLPFDPETSAGIYGAEIPDNDPIYVAAKRLIEVDKFAGVILIGPPGTGKTWYARQIGIKLVSGMGARLREVQFHSSYQYEDFVEGYAPDGKGSFKPAPGHLLKICSLAVQSTEPHVLIIDELSRTDPSRVMGEAMTYMESTLRGQPFYLASGRRVLIPSNLIFIATMNPEDRSVDEIDAAMDRRWGKIYLPPDPTVLNKFLVENGAPDPLRASLIGFFQWVQPHHSLGHAFFRTVADRAALERLWHNQLRFLFDKAFRYDADTRREIEERWAEMLSALDDARS